jgi:hypothetical protein
MQMARRLDAVRSASKNGAIAPRALSMLTSTS